MIPEEENEELNVVPEEGTGAENEETTTGNEEHTTTDTETDPQTGDTTVDDPNPGAVVEFPEFTAEKMAELTQEASQRTDAKQVEILTQNVLYRIRSQANLGYNRLSVLYDSPTLQLLPEYREAVIDNLTGLGYEVAREVIDDEEEYGISISW